MADLLIRGMEMPRVCANCFACKYDRNSGLSACNISGCVLMFADMMKRDKDCPLVEVPDHGRLIDADAFAAKYVAALPDGLAALNDPKNIPRMTAIIQALLLDIAEAETIIPASKEGGE